MTNYLLGECDPRIAMIDCNHNSFHPPFEHVFDEHFEPTYMELAELEAEFSKGEEINK